MWLSGIGGRRTNTINCPTSQADLVRRNVAVIEAHDTLSALAAKVATETIPIVFTTGGDPVRDGLVTNLNRPGGHITGVSFIAVELGAKQVGLLHELRAGPTRIAVLVDPKWPLTEQFVSEVRAAARAIGQQIEVLYASSGSEIDTAFANLSHKPADALFGRTQRIDQQPPRTTCYPSGLLQNPCDLSLT